MTGPLVLVVEDDMELLQLASLMLEQDGVRVVTAANGKLALDALDALQPDVIVTDMMMPELDGVGLIEKYHGRAPPHAPIIAVSGFLPYLEQAKQLGAVAALAKPYNPRELSTIIHELATGRTPKFGPSPPPFREDERARLQAVLDLRLEEPVPELGLQRFLDEVAIMFDVPVAGISVVTSDQQRLVAQCSTAPRITGGDREGSFCTHAVSARAALVVQDSHENPFFRDSPSVTERGFRFYAGVPLVAAHGEAVGTLCVLDYKAHRFTYLDLELLGLLAKRVLAVLEWRDKRLHTDVPDSAYRYLQHIDAQLQTYGKSLFADLVAVEASRAVARGEPVALVALACPVEKLEAIVCALRENVPWGLIGRLGLARLGVIVPGKRATEAGESVLHGVGADTVVVAVELDRYQGATGQALLAAEQALGGAGL